MEELCVAAATDTEELVEEEADRPLPLFDAALNLKPETIYDGAVEYVPSAVFK